MALLLCDKRASAPRTDLTPAAEGCGKKHARHKGHVIRYSAPVSRRRLPSFVTPPPSPGVCVWGRGVDSAPCDPASRRRRLQVQSQVAGTCRCRPSALRCRRGPVASWCRRVCLVGLDGLGVEPESEALSRGLTYVHALNRFAVGVKYRGLGEQGFCVDPFLDL